MLITPLVMFALICALATIHPFGINSFLTEDLKYQYIDFFTWFRSVLLGEHSLAYSFAQGLGFNTWGLYSYYLASPFNLLVVLFDQAHLSLAIFVIVACKLSAITASFVFYLRKRFLLDRSISLLFALCFCFGSWMVTNLRNPLWLDAQILLPLMAWAIWRFLRSANNLTGWIPLSLFGAAILITCWYMGYMLLLFFAFYIIFELCVLIAEQGFFGAKLLITKIFTYIVAMLVTLGLSAWTFLPTIHVMLQHTPVTPLTTDYTTLFPEVLLGFFPSTFVLDETPQIYVSLLILALAIAFLFRRCIPLLIRVSAFLLMAFMVASTYVSVLQMVWCGFRVPNGFYSRTAFLVSFMLLWMASYLVHSVQMSAHARRGVTYPLTQRWILKPVSVLLVVATIVELALNARFCMNMLYTGYPERTHRTYVKATDDSLAALYELEGINPANDPSHQDFYRMDKTYSRSRRAALNEGFAHEFHQLSSYSSSSNFASTNLLNMLGYAARGEFSTAYTSVNPFMDSIMGIRYVSSRYALSTYEQLALPEDGNQAHWYKNPYALGLGFGVSGNIEAFSVPQMDHNDPDTTTNPFELQNEFAAALTGNTDPIFTPICTITIPEDTRPQTPARAVQTDSWTFEVPSGMQGFVYVRNPFGFRSYQSVKLQVDDPATQVGFKDISERFTEGIYPLEEVAVSTTTTQTADGKTTTSYTLTTAPGERFAPGTQLICYGYNTQRAVSYINQLSAHQFELTSFSDTYIAGEYTSEADGLMLLTMPYDTGWTLRVNGIEQQPCALADDALMGVVVQAGTNHIELSYTTPFFLVGCIVTLGTAGGLCMLVGIPFIVQIKIKHKKCRL